MNAGRGSGQTKSAHRFPQIKENQQALLMLVPVLLIMGIFTIYPLFDAFRLAFTNDNLLSSSVQYIGLGNFSHMLADQEFWVAIKHSFILTAVVVALQLVSGLILASAMRQDVFGMGLFKSIIMASWVIPVAATVTIFMFMAEPGVGFINIVLKVIGLGNYTRYWFGSLHFAFPFIMLLNLWRNVPFYSIAFLAAMQAIPQTYYEAAEIDGAGALAKFRYITLPGIRNMIVVIVTIHVLWTFNNFSFVWLSTGGGPVDATDVLPTLVYRITWQQYNIGYAASIGSVMFVILMIYFVVYMSVAQRQELSS
jgi:multiple sugar transport system permease protein